MSRIERRQYVLEARKREETIEVMLLRGEGNVTRIAAALGISRRTVTRHEVRIRRRWAHRTLEMREQLLQERSSQLDMIVWQGMDGYARSKQPSEKTIFKNVKCECGGKVECGACGGTGRMQVVERQITEQVGDPSFLKVALDALKEKSSIQGLHVERTEIDVNLRAMVITMEAQSSDKLDALINMALDVRRENLALAAP